MWIKGSDIGGVNRWFAKELRRRSVWTLILQLSVSFSVVISHRASPARCSAIHRSSLGWTPCHFSLQRFSLSLLSQGKRGLVSKSSLGLHSSSTFSAFFFSFRSLPPPLLPPLLLLLSNHLALRPVGADCTVLRGTGGFSCFCFFFYPSAVLCPGGVEINKERARRCQKTTGISCSSKKYKEIEWILWISDPQSSVFLLFSTEKMKR